MSYSSDLCILGILFSCPRTLSYSELFGQWAHVFILEVHYPHSAINLRAEANSQQFTWRSNDSNIRVIYSLSHHSYSISYCLLKAFIIIYPLIYWNLPSQTCMKIMTMALNSPEFSCPSIDANFFPLWKRHLFKETLFLLWHLLIIKPLSFLKINFRS